MDLTPAIVAQVAAWVSMHTGIPLGVPTVIELSPAEMTQAVPDCRAAAARSHMLVNRRCSAAGIYDRDERIVYVQQGIPQEQGVSLLAHEFGHVARHQAGAPDPRTSCEARKADEDFALAVQQAYHDAHGIGWRVPPNPIRCEPSSRSPVQSHRDRVIPTAPLRHSRRTSLLNQWPTSQAYSLLIRWSTVRSRHAPPKSVTCERRRGVSSRCLRPLLDDLLHWLDELSTLVHGKHPRAVRCDVMAYIALRLRP